MSTITQCAWSAALRKMQWELGCEWKSLIGSMLCFLSRSHCSTTTMLWSFICIWLRINSKSVLDVTITVNTESIGDSLGSFWGNLANFIWFRCLFSLSVKYKMQLVSQFGKEFFIYGAKNVWKNHKTSQSSPKTNSKQNELVLTTVIENPEFARPEQSI